MYMNVHVKDPCQKKIDKKSKLYLICCSVCPLVEKNCSKGGHFLHPLNKKIHTNQLRHR